MHKVVNELLDRGIEVTVVKTKGVLSYKVDGFFKAGSVVLGVKNESELVCFSRYGQADSVTCFSDLVMIAYNWWKLTCDLNPSSEVDPGVWATAFESLGLVKKEVKTFYR